MPGTFFFSGDTRHASEQMGLSSLWSLFLSLWRSEEGQAVFRAGVPGAAPLASLSISWGGGCLDPAPLLPLSGQSVVPEPKDEVEACEGGSAHLPSWAGPRGWGLCSFSEFRVRFSMENKRLRTEPLPNSPTPIPLSPSPTCPRAAFPHLAVTLGHEAA